MSRSEIRLEGTWGSEGGKERRKRSVGGSGEKALLTEGSEVKEEQKLKGGRWGCLGLQARGILGKRGVGKR